MQILDGLATSARIREQIREEALPLLQSGRKPHLSVILVGNNPASESYVSSKVRTCGELGFGSELIRYPETVSESELLDRIRELNEDIRVNGILVQLPLPAHISSDLVIRTIDPDKDVDGFHPVNQGRMLLGQPGFLPATPYGILLLLEHYGIRTSGMHAAIIGRSHIVGSPMSVLLARNGEPGNATVTLCHSKTKGLKDILQQADLIVAAIGRPGYVTADMVKEGAVVIDVGINRIEDASRKSGYRLTGDVDFEGVSPRCSYITPVPGGVGPMTICGLMKNTLLAAQRKQNSGH